MTQPTVVSTICEDYPCCGHGPPPLGDSGGCPVRYSDGSERFKCVSCGRLMAPGARSAICGRCNRRMDEMEYDNDSFGWDD